LRKDGVAGDQIDVTKAYRSDSVERRSDRWVRYNRPHATLDRGVKMQFITALQYTAGPKAYF